MRTTKRFTPTVLARFFRQGRGLGTLESYIPWHRVGRGDPSSMGRSHLQMWKGRQREVLSDGEWVGLFFTLSVYGLIDVVEQFPLSKGENTHEASRYRADVPPQSFPGTIELAKKLNIKHPKTNEVGKSDEWVMTTDFLLVLNHPSEKLELLAVAFKPKGALKKRTRDLLNLEREYWLVRGVTWLLITPELYDPRVALRLRDSMPWALENLVPEKDLIAAVPLVHANQGRSITHIYSVLSEHFGNDDYAKRAFWQAVWSGKIPLDLRRGWRPHVPITLLCSEEFESLNPIASRRSSWI